MAVKVIKKTKSGASTKDVLAHFQKEMGETIGNFGGALIATDRIPTGLFPFDLATGGGFPRGCCSIVFGPESSNKTNMALRAIAMNQKLMPHETNVWVAIEPFDKAWAQRMGVDTDKLAVMSPSYAEQAVDIAESFLHADDCGLLVLDSLGAMITTVEAEKSAESANPGGQGLVVGKLVRKTTLALNEARKAGRCPTLIYVNQNRFKIGVMFGNPETMPGGQAPKFQAQLWIRVYGKNKMDSKISDSFPVLKEVSFTIQKHKVPILASSGKYEMVVHPHNGLEIGETDDFHTIAEYLKSFGAFEKADKKGWKILDVEYPTINAFKDRVYQDRTFGNEVRQAIIARALQEHATIPAQGTTVDEDGVVEDAA